MRGRGREEEREGGEREEKRRGREEEREREREGERRIGGKGREEKRRGGRATIKKFQTDIYALHSTRLTRFELACKAKKLGMRWNEVLVEAAEHEDLRSPVLGVRRVLLQLEEAVACCLQAEPRYPVTPLLLSTGGREGGREERRRGGREKGRVGGR